MTTTTRNDAYALLRKPPAKWARAISNFDRKYLAREALSDSLAEIATRAVYLAVYAGSPSNHREASRAARRAVLKVRQAMRFSYPEGHPLVGFEMEPTQ